MKCPHFRGHIWNKVSLINTEVSFKRGSSVTVCLNYYGYGFNSTKGTSSYRTRNLLPRDKLKGIFLVTFGTVLSISVASIPLMHILSLVAHYMPSGPP